MGYPNGQWPDSELVVVQGSGANAIRLNRPTAAVLRRMQTDAATDGVTITLVNSYRGAAGYRSKATQLDMRARPSLYDITPGIIPGLPSGHGDADCMDFDQGLAWVKTDGQRYGVTFPLAFDHNHARYDGITFAGEPGTPIIVIEKQIEEIKMKWFLQDTGNQCIVGVYTFRDYGDPNRAEIVGRLQCDQTEPIKISTHEYQILKEEWSQRVAEHKTLGL